MRWSDLQRARATPRRSALLFLTDRCPVGCAHCSVDSRPESPTIRDFATFERLVLGLAAEPELEVIGISGGEPMLERRGLTLAIERLTRPGRSLVLYTSGVWAREELPSWMDAALRAFDTVVLSTDRFHRPGVSVERCALAARHVSTRAHWLVLQVLDEAGEQERGAELLERALGAGWRASAEIVAVSLLPYGRAAGMMPAAGALALGSCPPCDVLQSPVVRYDGVVSACCNERISMGEGPERLRRRAVDADGLSRALAELREDPLLRLMAACGPAGVVEHPRLASLAEAPVQSLCEACWRLAEVAPPASDPLFRLMGLSIPPPGGHR